MENYFLSYLEFLFPTRERFGIKNTVLQNTWEANEMPKRSVKGFQQSNNASGSEDIQANAGQMVLERFIKKKKMKVIQ